MKHQKDCGINSNVGIPKIQKDESYCTCNFTPTVDSSVEESQISKLQVQFNLSSAYAFALYKMIQKDRQSLITRIKGEVENSKRFYIQKSIEGGVVEVIGVISPEDLLNRIDKIV